MGEAAGQLRRNIEFKARVASLDDARKAVASLECSDRFVQLQADTYFRVAAGRLKLREIAGVRAEPIWYDRADSSEARDSSYIISPTNDPAGLKLALSAALGVRGVVRKRREVCLHQNVRIHLDEVESLGTFIEFEAVITSPEQESPSRPLLGQLSALLGIREGEICRDSYADLLGL